MSSKFDALFSENRNEMHLFLIATPQKGQNEPSFFLWEFFFFSELTCCSVIGSFDP